MAARERPHDTPARPVVRRTGAPAHLGAPHAGRHRRRPAARPHGPPPPDPRARLLGSAGRGGRRRCATPALVQECRERFGAGYSIRYSSTESGGIGLGTALDADDEEALHTIGRPRPGVEAEIRDPDGNPVADGSIGELWLRSDCVMSGYWNDPEATATTLVEGWLRTGDLARIDERGLFRLAGRLKEMYIRGGYNVYPMEVESVLVGHPAVAEVAIVPRPDPVMGEIGVAVLVVAEGSAPPALEELRDFGIDHLAAYKLPEAIRAVDALPRNSSDKVDRRTLAASETGR
ncbi:MAG: AMP-binding protein [Acidimicrobiales bacterium]